MVQCSEHTCQWAMDGWIVADLKQFDFWTRLADAEDDVRKYLLHGGYDVLQQRLPVQYQTSLVLPHAFRFSSREDDGSAVCYHFGMRSSMNRAIPPISSSEKCGSCG